MADPIETTAEALLREQGARFDGFALHLDDLEPEDRTAALGEARAALASLAQHRDDIARVLAVEDADTNGEMVERAWATVQGAGATAVKEYWLRQADAVLAYLTGGAS